MKRKIIEIDEDKCNGCAMCLSNCPEGALQLVDGKARLVNTPLCDGLGACIGECPQGAIRVVEQESEPYSEHLVMSNIVRQGGAQIETHLKHLKAHGEIKLLNEAISFLKEQGIVVPEFNKPGKLPCGCPSSMTKKIVHSGNKKISGGASALRQWPVQLTLLNPLAEYFDDAELLISADCVAHAYGSFHHDLLQGRIVIIFCPKLDENIEKYVEKLADIFQHHDIRSVTVARMEVPCCSGTVAIVKKALDKVGKQLEIKIKIIGIDGEMQ